MADVKLLAAALLLCVSVLAGCVSAPFRPAEAGPRVEPVPAPDPQQMQAALDRGVAFLVQDQNPGGSWGTVRSKTFNIVMPVPGGHQAMRAAVTALCISALIETHTDVPGADEALRRGGDWLIENLPDVRLCSLGVMYNNWAHAYGIEALVLMLRQEPADSPRRAEIERVVRQQLARLFRFQHLDGGWGYYNYSMITSTPYDGGTSFTTATVLTALHEAREAGFDLPDDRVQKALTFMRRQRRPDFAYTYKGDATESPTWGLTTPPASQGRTQACNAAMYLWGDEETTVPVVENWLHRICARNGWLDLARKGPYPHAGYRAIAAYFYYYGLYYAAVCIDLMPKDDRALFQNHLARTLLSKQEKDGSWWDYPLFNYHQQYGTALALRSLARCRAAGPYGKETR